MSTSTNTAWALVLCVALALAGCGSSGDPELTTAVVVAFFLFGDPGVAFEGNDIQFTVGGAPSDGSVQRIDPLEATARALTQGFDLAILLAYAVAYELAVTPATLDVRYDLAAAHEDNSPSLEELVASVELWHPVEFDENDQLRSGTDTVFRFAREQHEVRSTLGSPTVYGVAHTGIDIDLEGCIQPDFSREFSLTVHQAADSLCGADQVQLFLGGVLVDDLGALVPGTAQTLLSTVTLDPADSHEPLELRFSASQTSFFRSFRVEFAQEVRLTPPPLQTRVYDLPFPPEGVQALDRDLYELVRPLEAPFGIDAYAFSVAGSGVLEGLAEGPPGGIDATDSADPAPGTITFRTRFLIPGVHGNPDDYWKPGAAGGRASSHVVAARVLVGAWGISIANYDPMLQDFEPHTVLEAGNMTDVCPFDGLARANRAVYVDNTADAIKFLELDAQDRYVLDPASTLTNTGWAGASGKAVSACRHPSGDLLFCTDGDPGELWLYSPGAANATKVDDLYGAPRTVRTAGNIAAVGCYGSPLGFGGLRLFVRSPGGTWLNAPFSRLGARSVGIDLRELPDGRVAVASTGFLTDKLVLTILDGTTGEILDDQEIALPAGCTGPGHCAFVRDAGTDGVFVTCNTSRQLVLLPVDFGP